MTVTPTPATPVSEMLEMLSAFWNSCALHVAARLSLSDHLAREPRSAEELAAVTGTHAPSLYRLLRMLAGIGVYREREDGRFENTPRSETLRSDIPTSLRGSALHRAGSLNVLAWNDLLETVRTGEPAFARIHGKEIFDYMADHPERAREFGEAMTSRSLIENPAIVEAYDFSKIGTLVDIGGGHGSLMAEILRRTPGLQGIVFDRPEVIEVARRDGFLRAEDLKGRGELIAGNFFESVPKADAYIMKYILHDWDDDRCVRILANCMRASDGKARVLVVDTVVPPRNEPHRSKSLDVHMMLVTGGKERTREEFAQIFERAGLRLERIVPTQTVHSIVEGVAN
jgi:hypothetical protein